MSNNSNPDWQGHLPLSPMPATRRWPWLLLSVIVALACAAGVYAWPEIVTMVPALDHEASAGRSTAGDNEALPDLLATQQKFQDDLAALGQTVADQQEKLKTIVDQLVALTSKVEALQRAAPPSAPPPVAAAPTRAPIAQSAPRSRKPPSRVPEPSGAISIGGAPLPVTPGETSR
jgi:uncharacterized coiled-coil protein SlyX